MVMGQNQLTYQSNHSRKVLPNAPAIRSRAGNNGGLPSWNHTQDGISRNLYSVYFMFHRITLGLFRSHTVIKLGVVCCGTYFMLGVAPKRNDFTPVIVAVEETAALESPLSTSISEPIKETPEKQAEGATFRPEIHPNRQTSTPQSENEAAPVSHKEIATTSAKSYIRRYARIARAEMNKFGVPASISLAQGLIESRSGTSKLAVNNNNHFGIKCFSRKCKKGHCSNHSDDSHKDFFRIFNSSWESWRAHSELISSGRYATLKKHGKNYRKWAEGLEHLGYATDNSYSEKLIATIQKYHLNEFD
jgi:flagellum-specific peptidoglycan hydrolase FlgJ